MSVWSFGRSVGNCDCVWMCTPFTRDSHHRSLKSNRPSEWDWAQVTWLRKWRKQKPNQQPPQMKREEKEEEKQTEIHREIWLSLCCNVTCVVASSQVLKLIYVCHFQKGADCVHCGNQQHLLFFYFRTTLIYSTHSIFSLFLSLTSVSPSFSCVRLCLCSTASTKTTGMFVTQITHSLTSTGSGTNVGEIEQQQKKTQNKMNSQAESALIFDSVYVFVAGLTAMGRNHAMRPTNLSCELEQSWQDGIQLYNHINAVSKLFRLN